MLRKDSLVLLFKNYGSQRLFLFTYLRGGLGGLLHFVQMNDTCFFWFSGSGEDLDAEVQPERRVASEVRHGAGKLDPGVRRQTEVDRWRVESRQSNDFRHSECPSERQRSSQRRTNFRRHCHSEPLVDSKRRHCSSLRRGLSERDGDSQQLNFEQDLIDQARRERH